MISKHLTFVQAVDLFVGANVDWLSTTEQPMITALYKAAEKLDKGVAATLLSEYRQIFREVLRNKPGTLFGEAVDEFDQLMAGFDK